MHTQSSSLALTSSSPFQLQPFAMAEKLRLLKLLYHRAISNSPYLLSVLLLLLPRLLSLSPSWPPSTIAAAALPVAMAAVAIYAVTRRRPVFLVEVCCFKPGEEHMSARSAVLKQLGGGGACAGEEAVEFQRRVLERCGIGDAAYLPASLLRSPMDMRYETAREEAETVVFGAVDELFRATGVASREVAILVVNCSTYTPSPAYTDMIVNRYKLRGDVMSYNLSGMGCSAGLISIDLVKFLLQVHPNSYALVVSTENITLNAYFGDNRSMLVSNSLFRMGGAALLLSNNRADRCRSKYQLSHTLRTTTAADARSHSCVSQSEDAAGRLGIALSKDLMSVAGDALKANITALGPLVLPASEQLLFLAAALLRRLIPLGRKAVGRYVPDFKLAFEHFCIHAGGRAVLDALEDSLGLSPWHMEPSRMTLYRFGNTSSSSLWYELCYCEAKGRIRRGDRVWQIAFGSGFKCNSAVWRALGTVERVHRRRNPWAEEVDKFPVEVPKVAPLAP